MNGCRKELSMQQVTNIQRQNCDILEKIPFGLVRENTSGVTLFTLLFRGRSGDSKLLVLTTSRQMIKGSCLMAWVTTTHLYLVYS